MRDHSIWEWFKADRQPVLPVHRPARLSRYSAGAAHGFSFSSCSPSHHACHTRTCQNFSSYVYLVRIVTFQDRWIWNNYFRSGSWGQDLERIQILHLRRSITRDVWPCQIFSTFAYRTVALQFESRPATLKEGTRRWTTVYSNDANIGEIIQQ